MTVADLAIYQRAYKKVCTEEAVAKAQMEAKESTFIKSRGIINPNGHAPRLLCEIQDKSAFDKATKEFASEMATTPLPGHLQACRYLKSVAETKLIEFVMDRLPPLLRDGAQRLTNQDINGHQWMVDIALTVQAEAVRETELENDWER